MAGETAQPKLTPDQLAAHDFLSELRTRITLQPLPYQSGVEARALESLFEVFGQARATMKKYPGCMAFAEKVTALLNMELRPVTAKWHRAHAEGRLNSRDGADEFRGDLADVQLKLWAFAEDLHRMAYNNAELADEKTPPVMSDKALALVGQDVKFGIADDNLIPADVVKKINADEAAAVALRRQAQTITTTEGMNAVGLGLSGGGIRSATFCLGAVQVLAARGLLKGVDFLSTVSGGGYTGSFLTSRLGNGEKQDTVAGPQGPDPDAVRRVRQYAKYMAASDLKHRWWMVTGTLAGTLLNWTAPLPVIALLALAAQFIPRPNWGNVTLLCGALAGLALMLYALLMRSRGAVATVSAWMLGLSTALFAASAVALLIDGLRFEYLFFSDVISVKDLGSFKDLLASYWEFLSTIGSLAAAPVVMRFLPILQKPIMQRIALQALLLAVVIVVPWFATFLFYVFLGLDQDILIVLVVVSGVIALVFLNVNLTSPHRLYRDQLAQTFIQRDEKDGGPKPLTAINPAGCAPYHLINTTVNLPSSKSVTLRDRRSDFFLFSKHWSGSPATEYRPTKDWRANGRPVDLATAMAISGAAFSSHMGLNSMRTLTALLTFANVRLGFWIRNPARGRVWGAPGGLCLLREMFGFGMSEKKPWLNLSDGGHIENMAVYELLRRRCKFIISIDGEADPKSTFPGHLTLVRHAQIDLGIRIDSTLEDLRPSPASKHSRTHYMFCRIRYPNGDCGLLLYVKLSATGNEEELIKRYRLNNPDFPHQSTLDQFFDEEQFEAYRQLGVHVLDGLFSPALMNRRALGKPTAPQDIPAWFAALSENLLEPSPPAAP